MLSLVHSVKFTVKPRTQMSSQPHTSASGPRWVGLFDDRLVILPRRSVPVSLLRILASISQDHALIRDRESPVDDVLDDGSTIDLAEGNVFRTAPRCDVAGSSVGSGRAKKAFSVDDRFEIVVIDELKREDLLSLFGLPPTTAIVRDLETPNDQEISPGAVVRFHDGPSFLTRGAHPQHIDVVIATTAGFYPAEGAERVPINQPVKVQLAKAAKALKIVDTAGWIARVGTQEIDVEKSYAANGLTCKVEIDYSRREGGGGS